jgi:hypothetical protein
MYDERYAFSMREGKRTASFQTQKTKATVGVIIEVTVDAAIAATATAN